MRRQGEQIPQCVLLQCAQPCCQMGEFCHDREGSLVRQEPCAFYLGEVNVPGDLSQAGQMDHQEHYPILNSQSLQSWYQCFKGGSPSVQEIVWTHPFEHFQCLAFIQNHPHIFCQECETKLDQCQTGQHLQWGGGWKACLEGSMYQSATRVSKTKRGDMGMMDFTVHSSMDSILNLHRCLTTCPCNSNSQ